MRGRSYSYSPSPPRGYGRRGRSPSPKGRYGGGRSRDLPTSLLVRNLRHDCREPRGFGFIQFVDPSDAADAKYNMDGEVLLGRELTVVFAEENRKKPSEMRARDRVLTLCSGVGTVLTVGGPAHHDTDTAEGIRGVLPTTPLLLEAVDTQGRFPQGTESTGPYLHRREATGSGRIQGRGLHMWRGAGALVEARALSMMTSVGLVMFLLSCNDVEV
ncbi:Serine/arginine-rich SC35-like splicing factor SCL30A [Linum perenne]